MPTEQEIREGIEKAKRHFSAIEPRLKKWSERGGVCCLDPEEEFPCSGCKECERLNAEFDRIDAATD
jgi:hypothetical protein